MVKYLIPVYTWAFAQCLYAQNPEIDFSLVGAGPFISTEQSQWAVFRNMAGLSKLDSWNAVLAYHYPYDLKELRSFIWGVVIPSTPAIAVSIFQKGSTPLVNQQMAISSALEIERVNIGIRVKYWRLSFSGHDPISSWSLAIGFQVQVSEKIVVGAFMDNITQSRIGYNETLPISWFTGLKYKHSDQILFALEVARNLNQLTEFNVGFDYLVKSRVSVRSGLDPVNKQSHVGLGFHADRFQIDYAASFHFSLGFSHQAGLYYSWP